MFDIGNALAVARKGRQPAGLFDMRPCQKEKNHDVEGKAMRVALRLPGRMGDCLWAVLAGAVIVSSWPLTAAELDEIEVIGVTPLHGTGVPAAHYPANVQVLGRDALRDGGLDLTDTMNRQLGSVTLNAAQNNPLQPDLRYRGFTASPLLGLPQGIAVYGDGVRLNSVFGDTVHWDTIPQHAIESVNLIPGSNPLFGLNTLGGALSLTTKSGFTFQGNRASLLGGSFGRWDAEAESGAQHGDWAHYLAVRYFDEDGWRDFSPSEAASLFGKISWQSEAARLHLGLNIADTRLIGNGPLPLDLLNEDRSTVFTRPDITENEYLALTLNGDTDLNENLILAGNLYFRKHNIDTLNGDDSDIEECVEPGNTGLLCIEDDGLEKVVRDRDGIDIAADDDLQGATINTSTTKQESYGGSLQLTLFSAVAGKDNQLIVGAAWDEGRARFRSQTELGSLDATRFAVGGGVIDMDSLVSVKAKTRTFGLYFADTLSVTERLTLNLAGRWNHTNIELDDRIGTALNGDHSFNRFNPSAGITYTFNPRTSVYGSYSEATRAPTPVELTCADPDDPCRLPNAFLSDPPLDQVVAKTFEVGARGRAAGVNWQAAVFTTTNNDDIIFISSGALTSEGFFDNIGDTRRRGIELSLNGRAGGEQVDWFVNYAYLDATFENTFDAPSANHPEAIGGEITVQKGDRVPGIPQHVFKAGAAYRLSPSISLGGELIYNSDQHLRGDESNQLGTVDGYTVVNLRGRYRVSKHFSVFAKIDNVFDTDFETFGTLGEPEEVLGAAYDDPRFLSPGAPRSGWIGVEASF